MLTLSKKIIQITVVFCFSVSSVSASAFVSSSNSAHCALPLYLQALQGSGGRHVSKKAKLRVEMKRLKRVEKKLGKAIKELDKEIRKVSEVVSKE